MKVRDLGDFNGLIGREPSEVANIVSNITPQRGFRDMTRTLTTLSQPQETMTGFKMLGLNRTHDTLEKYPREIPAHKYTTILV